MNEIIIYQSETRETILFHAQVYKKSILTVFSDVCEQYATLFLQAINGTLKFSFNENNEKKEISSINIKEEDRFEWFINEFISHFLGLNTKVKREIISNV